MIDNDLIFIVGLPGSGKTHLANTFTDRGRLVIDDPKQAPVLAPGIKYVIADPHLCYSRVFRQVSKLYPSAYYYLYANDLEQCWNNIQGRDDRNITYSYIARLSREYDPWEFSTLVKDYEVIDVYNRVMG